MIDSDKYMLIRATHIPKNAKKPVEKSSFFISLQMQYKSPATDKTTITLSPTKTAMDIVGIAPSFQKFFASKQYHTFKYPRSQQYGVLSESKVAPALNLLYLKYMVTTNMKGQLAVSKAELRAIELGFVPSRPLCDTRYDLIVDNGKDLIRAQVKYGGGKANNSSGNAIVKLDYETRTKKIYTYNNSEVDALIVYLPQIDKLCLFPKNVFIGKRKLSVRLEKSKNGQAKRVIAAKNYYW